jgi:hypothetical protein
MGFGLGSGVNLEIIGGAGLLFLTNLVAIVASAFLVFLLVGMNAAEVRERMLAASGSGPQTRILSYGPIARAMARGGQLRWRVLMLLILLGGIAIPLRKALLQVANETVTRGTVQTELKRIAPAATIVSQQVSVTGDQVLIRLISTRPIPDSKVAQVRQDLIRLTGHQVELSVESIASNQELADAMERFARHSQVEKQRTVAEMQKELVERVRPVLQDVWPSSDAPIQDFDILLGKEGITLDVRYTAATDLGDVPTNMILKILRSRLQIPNLILKAERIRPGGRQGDRIEPANRPGGK